MTIQIFDRIRNENPQQLCKIVCINGDLSEEPDLGLNKSDLKLLFQNVNVVFHMAATVRFDEPLIKALHLNTLATQNLLEMCTKMEQLQVTLACINSNTLQFLSFQFHRLLYTLQRLSVIIVTILLKKKYIYRRHIWNLEYC